MNHDELVNVLKIINTASVNGKSKDDATATVLRLAAESFTKDILRSLMEAKNIEDKNGNALTTEKESQMLIEAKGVSITSKATERIAKETGLNVTLHILRHTYATRLEEGNIQPKLKQYLLGHASLEVTQNIYTDTTTEYLESVSGKIQNVFCGI